jgi:hypothetical protein
MGTSRWSPDDWRDYSTVASTKTVDKLFVNRSLKDSLNPFDVKVRESRDSILNPESTALIFALDVTGSMGKTAELMAKKSLGVLVEEIYDRKPVPDPHVMIMAVGDAHANDRAPLQVSQFEADISIAKQLEEIWLEGGGGGNHFEGYDLPWYFAAKHTSIDCFEQRGKKGYLFTMGDEEAPQGITRDHIKRIFGEDAERDYSAEELLDMASKMYHVFHIIVEEGSHARHYPHEVKETWTALLGQRVIKLADHSKVAEVIVSAIEVNEGLDKDKVAKSWSGDTAVVVSRAIAGLPVASGKAGASTGGVVRFG